MVESDKHVVSGLDSTSPLKSLAKSAKYVIDELSYGTAESLGCFDVKINPQALAVLDVKPLILYHEVSTAAMRLEVFSRMI